MVRGLAFTSPPATVSARFDLTPADLGHRDPIRPGDLVWIAAADVPGTVTSAPWGFGSSTEGVGPADDIDPTTVIGIDQVPTDPGMVDAITRRRCLVLVDAVYLDPPASAARRLRREDGAPFAIASLRAPEQSGGGVAIISDEPAEPGPITDGALPVVLSPDTVEIWLYYSHATELHEVLRPPDDAFEID